MFSSASNKLLRRQDVSVILVDPNENVELLRSVFSAADVPYTVVKRSLTFDTDEVLVGLDTRLGKKIWDNRRQQIIVFGDPNDPFFVVLSIHLTSKFDTVFACSANNDFEPSTWLSFLRLMESNVVPTTVEQMLFELKSKLD